MAQTNYISKPTEGSYHHQYLTREDVIRAVKATKSNREAAMYVNVSKETWKKYASMYYDETGKNYYIAHNNKFGLGLKKKQYRDKKLSVYIDFLTGKIPSRNFDPIVFKREIIAEGYIPEKCFHCGYSEKRASDQKVALLLVFKDGNKKNWLLENLELYCFNCYFNNIGDIYSKKQLRYIEAGEDINNVYIKNPLELNEVHAKALENILDDVKKDPGKTELKPDDLVDTY